MDKPAQTTHLGTREKIMETARLLFAEKGFERTSIRDIAKMAEVNVAAVNYHFNSKENLIAEVVKKGHIEIAAVLREYTDKNDLNLEDTVVHLYKYFLQRSHDVISIFKIVISSDGVACAITENELEQRFGPPGGDVISEVIHKEIGRPISEEDLHWAINTLFTHVLHTAIIHIGQVLKHKKSPYYTEEDIERGIRRLAKVVLNELRSTNN